MSIEHTSRDSAQVISRVVDKSQVPSTTTWAALGCVTASAGELNHVYKITKVSDLESIFGVPTEEHKSLICANKIIEDDNTMFLIRVANTETLASAQVILPTVTTAPATASVTEGDADIEFKRDGKSISGLDSDIKFDLKLILGA